MHSWSRPWNPAFVATTPPVTARPLSATQLFLFASRHSAFGAQVFVMPRG